MKTFGQKDPHLHYYTRPGAYLIAIEEDYVILVETPKGYFLPGGGLDVNETHEECIHRECLEELGCTVKIHGKLAEAELGWKESTSYTILKRLCERGLFQNVKRTVTSLVSKEEFYALQSEKFVEDTFDGSLPAFLAAFAGRKKYTDEEVDKMKQILDSMRR